MSISKKDMKILLKSQQGELNAVLMYQALANVVKDKNDADTFRKLAAEEGHHAAVFHELTQKSFKPKKTWRFLCQYFIDLLVRNDYIL